MTCTDSNTATTAIFEAIESAISLREVSRISHHWDEEFSVSILALSNEVTCEVVFDPDFGHYTCQFTYTNGDTLVEMEHFDKQFCNVVASQYKF